MGGGRRPSIPQLQAPLAAPAAISYAHCHAAACRRDSVPCRARPCFGRLHQMRLDLGRLATLLPRRRPTLTRSGAGAFRLTLRVVPAAKKSLKKVLGLY